MNFRMFLHLIEGLRDDCKVKELDLDKLDVFISRSSGEVIFGVMDENQDIIDYIKWNGCI